MSLRLLLDERVVRAAVTDHDDGQRSHPDVHNKVLVVARLSALIRDNYGLIKFNVINWYRCRRP